MKSLKTMEEMENLLNRLQKGQSMLEYFKDFPKPGINFVEIFPLFRNKEYMEDVKKYLSLYATSTVMVPEARGFLFVPLLALNEQEAFPIRKEGKLPGADKKYSATKEYGSDILEYRKPNKFIVTFLDDVLATGGTAYATAKSLIEDGYIIDSFIFMIELTELNGREQLETIAPVYSMIKL